MSEELVAVSIMDFIPLLVIVGIAAVLSFDRRRPE